MKRIGEITIVVAALMLSACAKAPLTNRQVQYQTKGNKVLGKYAAAVSKGFLKPSKSSSNRGFIDPYSYADVNSGYSEFYSYGTPDHSYWPAQNGNYVLRQALSAEAEDCVDLIKAVPANCSNYPFMVASLSRCLDRVVAYKNPLLTYAYRNLDRKGQQYWAYLLDWRRPRPIQTFSLSDFSMIYPYASGGYVTQDIYQQ